MGEGFGGWKEEKLNATVFLTNPHMNGVGPDNIVQMAAVHIPGFFVISTFVATQRQHGQYLDGHSSLLAGFFSDRREKELRVRSCSFYFPRCGRRHYTPSVSFSEPLRRRHFFLLGPFCSCPYDNWVESRQQHPPEKRKKI